MNINESYDGRTWLKDWWVIVKSNFAIIKNKVEDITSDIDGINTQINNLNQGKQQKDFIVTCNAEYADKDTLTITNASASHDEIKKAIENDADVILKIVIDDEVTVYYARLEEDNEIGEFYYWSFLGNDVHYRICNDYSNIWYVYATELATAEDDALKTDNKTIVGAINDLDDKIELLDSYAHITPLKATVTVNDNNTLTISNTLDFHSILTEREAYNSEVILDITMGDKKYVAYPNRISTDTEGKFSFTFTDYDEEDWDNNKQYILTCDEENGWSGHVVNIATTGQVNIMLEGKTNLLRDDIDCINTQIGDINTALDSIITIQNELMGVSE